MKKIVVCLTTALLSFMFIPNEMKAASGSPKTEAPDYSTASKTGLNINPGEITSNNKMQPGKINGQPLNKTGRKNDNRLSEPNGGIFISVGALILIIVLLIILL